MSTSTTELTSQLDCCFIGFGSGVAEEHLPATAQQLVHEYCSFSSYRVSKKIADVHQCRGLFCNCSSNNRIAMAKRSNSDSTEKIEIALAVYVPQLRSRTTLEHDLRWAKNGNKRTMVTRCGKCVRCHFFPTSCSAVIMVPTPAMVNNSISKTCGIRPSKM